MDHIRVALIGNVDSGKSTLVGVLSKGHLDDGRGKARQHVFRHKHEIENGRTSSVSNEIIGFCNHQQILENQKQTHENNSEMKKRWTQIVEKSDKIISLIDLCGHEKYLKTTIYAMTSLIPDVAIVVVGANMGVQVMTKEHLCIASSLNIPIMVVITKIDIAPSHILKDTKTNLKKILKSMNKMPLFVQGENTDYNMMIQGLNSGRVVPIFMVSSVSGEKIDCLKNTLCELPKRQQPKQQSNGKYYTFQNVFMVDDVYYGVAGTQCVVSGLLKRGQIQVHEHLLFGPDATGNYFPVAIRSIEYMRTNVENIEGGQTATLSLRNVKLPKLKGEHVKQNEKQIEHRKGMVLLKVDEYMQALANNSLQSQKTQHVCLSFRSFVAEIMLLHHQTTIGVGYETMIHTGVIRQSAVLTHILTHHTSKSSQESCQSLRIGDRARVQFKFLFFPEFIEKGSIFIFRDGRAKGIGKIKKVLQ